MLRVSPLRSFLLPGAAISLSFPQPSTARLFSTSPARAKGGPRSSQLPPRPKPPPEDEIEEFFLQGSGPGGQKINKTASSVQLRHKPTGMVVKSQATRSRSDNRRIARNLLALRLDELKNGAKSRTAVVGAFKKMKADSAAKKSKRKYKKLDDKKGNKPRPSGKPGEPSEPSKPSKQPESPQSPESPKPPEDKT